VNANHILFVLIFFCFLRCIDRIMTQYEAHVKPMHAQWVEPSKGQADVIINSETGSGQKIAVDMLTNHLRVAGNLDS
jgi:uridine kinase